ncbi:hypothetical protein SAMN04487914_14814 [Arthrobacter sp. ok909]|nr:hypothetical protein SAMN04487914_14814 [Arthrobacter sp. ok909]
MAPELTDVRRAIEAASAAETARINATLIRVTGDWGLAETIAGLDEVARRLQAPAGSPGLGCRRQEPPRLRTAPLPVSSWGTAGRAAKVVTNASRSTRRIQGSRNTSTGALFGQPGRGSGTMHP